LPDGESEKFFAKGLDRKIARQPVGQISRSASTRDAVWGTALHPIRHGMMNKIPIDGVLYQPWLASIHPHRHGRA
jgi:hypothetical protein